jgi:hypothetical protein
MTAGFFTTGAYTGTYSPTINAIEVLNFPGNDKYTAEAGRFTGPSLGTFSPGNVTVELFDFDAAMFASDLLPLTPPSLADTEQELLFINFRRTVSGVVEVLSVHAHLTSLVLAPAQQRPPPGTVPEPGTLALRALGLVGLVPLRRRVC